MAPQRINTMTKHPILNLIKYDLRFIHKQLIVFYIIILSCAIIARITNFDTTSFWLKFIHGFAQGAAFGFSFGTLVNGSIRTWARFRSSLYGDESYLTHTLPLAKHTIWTSKFLVNLIVSACSMLTIIAAIFIMFFPFSVELRSFGLQPGNEAIFWQTIIAFVIAVFLQVIYIIQSGFTGVLIGHRASDRRTLLSIFAGFGTYILGGVTIILLCFGWSQFNPSVKMLLQGHSYENTVTIAENQTVEVATEQANVAELLYGISFFYIILISTTYLLDRQLLQKGVNVD